MPARLCVRSWYSGGSATFEATLHATTAFNRVIWRLRANDGDTFVERGVFVVTHVRPVVRVRVRH